MTITYRNRFYVTAAITRDDRLIDLLNYTPLLFQVAASSCHHFDAVVDLIQKTALDSMCSYSGRGLTKLGPVGDT